MKQNSVLNQDIINSVKQIVQSDYFKESHILNLLPSALSVCDSSGVLINYNRKAVELWGRTPVKGGKNERFCGSYKLYNVNGEHMPHETSFIAACLKDGVPRENREVIIERPDLSRIVVNANIVPIKDEGGNILGLINCFYEIPQQNHTPEYGHKKIAVLPDNVLQSLQAAVYTTDAEGRIVLYNKAAVDLWGREPEVGKDLWCGSYKIFKTDGSYLPLDSCPMAICLKEQRAVYGEEILVVRPDGSIRNVAPHPQPLFDDAGKMIGAINLLVDITDIKRTELALRESEAKYRELASSLERKVEEKTRDLKNKHEELKKSEERYHKMIEEVEDYAIILLDKNGIIQNWNKGAEKIKGYKEEEIVGKSFSNFYLSEDRENGLPQKLLTLAREKGKAIHEGWRMRKDGSRFWGSIVLTALHDDQNNVIGFSKVTRDLTEKKLAEDKLKEYTGQLEFQNKELEQFAYAASHDMKEPLRKIHLYNSTIAENAANVLDEKSKEYLSRSLNAVKRMTGLIEDLLTYSKTTSNIENFDRVDLNEVIDEIILIHREEFEQNKVRIEAGPLPVINAVPFQVKQLMDNLFSNSIKYKHPERNVCIKIKAEFVNGSQITEWNAEPFRRYHKICVEDNGVGFDPEYAEKIFDIFQRLNNLPGTKGSGIGLAICKRIVQNHHGFIKAMGKINEGAKFYIYLADRL